MTTPCCPPIIPAPSPRNVQIPNNDHLVVRWENDGNIIMFVANWIPPENNCPLPAAARPTKKISKGMQHASEILGKLEVPTDSPRSTRSPHLQRCHPPRTFKFDGMLWTTDNDMPPNHAPTATNITTAKTPPEELVSSSALMNHKPTTEWQIKSPASRHPSASMANKSTAKWQTKSPASGQPSSPMAKKSTTKWHNTTPAPAKPQSTSIATIPQSK
jgi:hypothetical protein